MLNDLMKIKALLEAKLAEAEEEERDGEYIGDLPTHIETKLRALRKDRTEFFEDVELEKQRLKLEVKRKMEEQFDGRREELNKRHTKLWEEIYTAMNVNPNGHYYQENGKLFKNNCSCNGEDHEHGQVVDFTKPTKKPRF